jgi:hypothetical protein
VARPAIEQAEVNAVQEVAQVGGKVDGLREPAAGPKGLLNAKIRRKEREQRQGARARGHQCIAQQNGPRRAGEVVVPTPRSPRVHGQQHHEGHRQKGGIVQR